MLNEYLGMLKIQHMTILIGFNTNTKCFFYYIFLIYSSIHERDEENNEGVKF